jgi:hypothetical protein
MPHSNSHAGCCYLCAAYVGMGKGELVKNKVAGHRFSLRCVSCGIQAAKLTAAPTQAVLNDNAVALLRQTTRKEIRELLRDEDMPAEKVRPAQQWLESQQWPIEELHRVKKLLIQLRNETRDNHLSGRALAA